MATRIPSEYRSDRRLKAALTESLRSRGFDIFLLPTSTMPSADFRVVSETETILVELKSRAPVEMPPLPEVRIDALARTNALSAMLGKAGKQLSSSRASQDEVTLLWLLAPNVDRRLHYEQLAATAYGLRDVVGYGFIKPCYYASHSDFFRYRGDLDGIALGHYGALLLNDHSPNYERLRNVRLADLFRPAVTDPPLLEERGEAFIVRGDVDRADDDSVKRYLEEHYSVEVNHFLNMVRFSA